MHAKTRARVRTVRAESLEQRRLLSTVAYSGTTDYPVGQTPDALTSANLNSDSKADLVITNFYDDTASVLLGSGDGSFAAKQDYPVGKYPASVVASDLNLDDHPDLIVANEGATTMGTVSVLLGTANGTFGPEQEYAVGQTPRQAIVADVNTDGLGDVIAVNEGQGTDGGSISVLLSDGNGNLRPQTTFPVGGTFPDALAAGDFNGDQFTDIVTANSYDNTVSVLLGRGNDTFASPLIFDVGSSPDSVTVGDFNLDGKLDIAVANADGDSVSVLLGKGNGTFAAAKNYTAGSNPASLVAADMNDDDLPDLVVADRSSNTATVLINNGDGTFAPPRSFAVGSQPFGVVPADFNGDGNPDLATADFDDNGVRVLLNQPLFRAPKLISPATKSTGVGLIPTLNWTTISGAIRYRIIITTNPASLPTDPTATAGVPNAVDDQIMASTADGVNTHLQPGTKYYWEVQALNAPRFGNWSKISSFTTAPDTAPVVKKIANHTATVGATFSLTSSFTDPDQFDRWTGLIDWGDGTRKTSLTPSATKRLALAHVFKKRGTYKVTMTVTDHFGKSSAKTFAVKVA